MTLSVSLDGKAVWTDVFLDRYAPLKLACPTSLRINGADVAANSRLSDDVNNPLNFVKAKQWTLRMFRDGTLAFTVQTEFEDTPSGQRPTSSHTPSSVRESINRLNAMRSAIIGAFPSVIEDLLRDKDVRSSLAEHVRDDNELLKLGGLELVEADVFASNYSNTMRKIKEHSVIFVENFYEGEASNPPGAPGVAVHRTLPFKTVLSSSSLAGLLNSAKWYEEYNTRYVQRLASKEIGYKDNEIYLTDRKATVISAKDFWNTQNSLYHYMYDVVLAVEYNVALLAYISSCLAYFQEHPDVRKLDGVEPKLGLQYAIDGRALLSHIEESLDLTLLVDHGFTREFIRRLHDEFGFARTIGFIRQRVEDATTSVSLRSSVKAADSLLKVSESGLKAGIENNGLQRAIKGLAVAAVSVAVISAGWGLWLASRPQEVRFDPLCVSTRRGETVVSECRSNNTSDIAPPTS